MSINLPRRTSGIPHEHFERNIFTQQYSTDNNSTPQSGVGQDKVASPRDRIASNQAAPQNYMARPHRMNSNSSRSQNRPVPKRKTVHLTLWVKPGVKAELKRIAESEGLSVSAAGGAFLENALQQNLYTQHTALLDSIIDKAIGKHMRSYSSRLAVLLVRSSFASEQTRSLVTNILTRQPGVTQGVLKEILDGSSNAAKRNIKHISPQLSDLIEEVEKWMQEEEGEDTNQ